jgi:uncharacterized protein with PQ loop repeat
MYQGILYVVATLIGILMSVSHFSQAYKIYKRKSLKDISLTFFSTFALWNLIRLLYGLSLNQFPIIISFAIGLIWSCCVLFLSIKYRKTKI